ncbi:MAG TPA: MarR family transcriptional regulator [Acetobacteraceae bacterium]|nr:MarR family transcriptional regulator [Acetobacteraceae bacterium]
MRNGRLELADYVTLAQFREAVRRLCRESEGAARRRGLTPQQHQALLSIKATEGGEALSIGRLAERLGIRPHSTVELVDRLVQLRLVERRPDTLDHRRVRVFLTQRAQSVLDGLAEVHLRELRDIRPALEVMLPRVERLSGAADGAATKLADRAE